MKYYEPSTVREIVDHLLVEHYIDLFLNKILLFSCCRAEKNNKKTLSYNALLA